ESRSHCPPGVDVVLGAWSGAQRAIHAVLHHTDDVQRGEYDDCPPVGTRENTLAHRVTWLVVAKRPRGDSVDQGALWWEHHGFARSCASCRRTRLGLQLRSVALQVELSACDHRNLQQREVFMYNVGLNG